MSEDLDGGLGPATRKAMGKAVDLMLSSVGQEDMGDRADSLKKLLAKGKVKAAKKDLKKRIASLTKDGEIEAATELLEAVRPDLPNDPLLLELLADCYLRSRRRWQEAGPVLDRLMKESKSSPILRYGPCVSGNNRAAIAILTRLLITENLDPPYPFAFVRLARSLLDTDPERAESLLERACRADPDDPAVHALLLRLHVTRGEEEFAVTERTILRILGVQTSL
jgi:predicted Zn-dependent protease